MDLDRAMIRAVVDRALSEDLGGAGDITARAARLEHLRARAIVVTREPGVIAGLPVAEACFAQLDDSAAFTWLVQDGGRVEAGQKLFEVEASAVALSSGERSALNLLQRLSGIATVTRRFVDAVAGTGARILDTRKTTPGLRALEKYAVRMGGGNNHRFGLFDQVLLKENHFAMASDSMEAVVRRAVDESSAVVVAEARSLEEALAVVRGGAGVVLLDNFEPGDKLRAVVAEVRSAARTDVEIEASGGVRLDNVRAFAECGVDRISVGALTHSVRSIDLSMLVEVVR